MKFTFEFKIRRKYSEKLIKFGFALRWLHSLFIYQNFSQRITFVIHHFNYHNWYIIFVIQDRLSIKFLNIYKRILCYYVNMNDKSTPSLSIYLIDIFQKLNNLFLNKDMRKKIIDNLYNQYPTLIVSHYLTQIEGIKYLYYFCFSIPYHRKFSVNQTISML